MKASEKGKDDVGFDCERCIAKELVNSQRGRLCLFYHDFEVEPINYKTESSTEKVSGVIDNQEELTGAITKIVTLHKVKDVTVALKFFFTDKIRGICPQSFPKSHLTSNLLEILNLCLGGETGNELAHLPFEGSILEQPNLFIEGYRIWVKEHSDYMRKKHETH